MRITKANRLADFNGSIRKYYDLDDIRIIDVNLYDNEEKAHYHEKVTEVLFVIHGNIDIETIDGDFFVIENDIVTFLPGEQHKLKPKGCNTRILVFKYFSTNNNLTKTFAEDWIGVE